MIEMTDSEIDVEQLMVEIRAAVERREAEGQRSLIGASVELYEMLSAAAELQSPPGELPPISLQPEFIPRDDDHYHVNDLLPYHDHTFIWNAYRAILKREPDEPGLQEFLGKLRSGRFNKIDVLSMLVSSSEGRRNGVRVDGLARPAQPSARREHRQIHRRRHVRQGLRRRLDQGGHQERRRPAEGNL